MYEINFDYRLEDDSLENLTAIHLLMPEYKGVRYHYHQARIVEEDGLARLQYGYTILDSGEHDIDDLNSDEKFSIIMGDILQQIILKKLEHEQTGTDDTEESHLQ